MTLHDPAAQNFALILSRKEKEIEDLKAALACSEDFRRALMARLDFPSMPAPEDK